MLGLIMVVSPLLWFVPEQYPWHYTEGDMGHAVHRYGYQLNNNLGWVAVSVGIHL